MAELIRFDMAQRARYSQGAGIYRIIPASVARPTSLPELRQVLVRAAREGWNVTPRGAGTAMDGGNVGHGLLLDLSAFDAGRCIIDSTSRSARTTPALSPLALNTAAAPLRLRFPPDPSSATWATLGGMLSTNASGARSLRSGSVRRWVREITLETTDGPLVLRRSVAPDPDHPVARRWNRDVAPRIAAARDEILARFPDVTKNSAGYALNHFLASGDLLDLVIGAEGTLGIVTDIQWLLEPMPAHRAALRLLVHSREDLVPAIDAVRDADPSTIEFLDRTFLRLIDPRLAGEAALLIPETAGVLLVDIEGRDAEEVRRQANAAAATARPWIRHVSIAFEADEIEQLWQIRHGASPALARFDDGRRSLQVIEDGAVPPSLLAAYLDAIESACASEGIEVVLFGHAGDGHVHANLLPDLHDPHWHERLTRIYDRVTDTVIQLGGTPSGEHGTGRLRSAALEPLYGASVMELFRAVKAAFDPGGRHNPGVLLSDGSAPLSSLKVGSDAAAVPEETEAYLRGIEQGARWGESRWLVR